MVFPKISKIMLYASRTSDALTAGRLVMDTKNKVDNVREDFRSMRENASQLFDMLAEEGDDSLLDTLEKEGEEEEEWEDDEVVDCDGYEVEEE